jgi:hypothetical protein
MGIISRKNLKDFRGFILSPKLENLLLLVYVISFAWIISIKISTMDGSGLRADEVLITNRQFKRNLRQYFSEDNFN